MRPHSLDNLDVLIVYKNFGAFQGISHIGLGVSALNTVKCLNKIGIRAQVMALKDQAQLGLALKANRSVTHVIVQAPWMDTAFLSSLCALNPDVQFAVVSHSNVGFLQADRGGIMRIKQGIQLEGQTYNFHIAGNSQKFTSWVENVFGEPCTYLPNLYSLHHCHGDVRRLWSDVGGTLRIGIFGATRSLKNIISAVGAAMEISSDLNAFTEVWVNSERDDGPDSRVIRASVKELLSGMPNLMLRECPWASWSEFKRVVGSMHLLLQPSYSESFNMVTADGVSEGVPSVVSDAVTWAPESWKASVDDVNDIARVGVQLLGDPEAARKGLHALRTHNRFGERQWIDYLTENIFGSATIK